MSWSPSNRSAWLAALVVGMVMLSSGTAVACDYAVPDPLPGFDAGEAAGPIALSLAAHSLSAVVLYKLWHETEPEKRSTFT